MSELARQAMSELTYPVRMKYFDYVIRLIDNDTLVWSGQGVWLVDANAEIFVSPDLSMNDPWWHCATCLADSKSDFLARASIGAKFCPECGTEFDWENTEKDPESEQEANDALRAELDAIVAEVEAESVNL